MNILWMVITRASCIDTINNETRKKYGGHRARFGERDEYILIYIRMETYCIICRSLWEKRYL